MDFNNKLHFIFIRSDQGRHVQQNAPRLDVKVSHTRHQQMEQKRDNAIFRKLNFVVMRCHSMTKQMPSTLQSPEPLRKKRETNSVAFIYLKGLHCINLLELLYRLI